MIVHATAIGGDKYNLFLTPPIKQHQWDELVAAWIAAGKPDTFEWFPPQPQDTIFTLDDNE